MDRGEIEAKKQEILKQFRLSITEYYNQLGSLGEQNPSFNIDIATDIHPELADYTASAGQNRLKFWTDVYTGLKDHPKYTVIRRYSTMQNKFRGSGVAGIYDEESGLTTSVDHAWVDVYEDLRPEDITFGRNLLTGAAYATIDRPSYENHTEGAQESTHLFSADAPTSFSVWGAGGVKRDPAVTAHSHEPQVTFYSSDEDLLLRSRQFTYIEELKLNLPIGLNREFRQSISERLNDA